MQSESVVDRSVEVLANIHWHDSILLEHHVLRPAELNAYVVRLDFDLVQGVENRKIQFATKSLIFRDCKLIQMELDLLGMTCTNAQISEATICRSFSELDAKTQESFRRYNLTGPLSPLEGCFFFKLELIAPGGSISLFARELEIHTVREGTHALESRRE